MRREDAALKTEPAPEVDVPAARYQYHARKVVGLAQSQVVVMSGGDR